MLRPGGYGVVTLEGRASSEHDTFTCAHCQRVVAVKPLCDPADMGGRCGVCDGLVCPRCVGKGCAPWERQMEASEARDRLYRTIHGG